jgi:hypothetical protein
MNAQAMPPAALDVQIKAGFFSVTIISNHLMGMQRGRPWRILLHMIQAGKKR